jgi:hypothetical protein
MLTRRKLALTLAFTGLVAIAVGVSCRGFFQNPTLSSIVISPASANVGIGDTATLVVYGTYSDGSRNTVTSGVSWSVDPTGIANITGSGNATITGVAAGSTTATADAQGLTSTASITVAGNVTSINATPSSLSFANGTTSQAITFAATPGPPDYITTSNGGTLVITTASGTVNLDCSVSTDTSGNPAEVCTDTLDTVTTAYSLVMQYTNQNGDLISSNTVTVTVTN